MPVNESLVNLRKSKSHSAIEDQRSCKYSSSPLSSSAIARQSISVVGKEAAAAAASGSRLVDPQKSASNIPFNTTLVTLPLLSSVDFGGVDESSPYALPQRNTSQGSSLECLQDTEDTNQIDVSIHHLFNFQ